MGNDFFQVNSNLADFGVADSSVAVVHSLKNVLGVV